MNRVRRWINNLMPSCDKRVVDDLIANYHIMDISELYCVKSINEIIGDAETRKRNADGIKLFFSSLWSCSKLMGLVDFLSGFGIDKNISSKLVKSGYNTIEKIRQVNYEQLLNMGISGDDAETFVDDIVYLSDDMDAVLNTNMVRLR